MLTETIRLILRDLQHDDLADLLAITSDPEVFRTNDYLPAEEATLRKRLDEILWHNAQEPRHSHNCAIVLKTTNELIGWIGFGAPSDLRKSDIDFGYSLNRAYWNRGYMTEAVRGMLAYCFDVVGAQTVTAYHMDNNPASGRVMQKAGMRLYDAMMRDHTEGQVHYVITAIDWRMA